jgi:hypothetical protein
MLFTRLRSWVRVPQRPPSSSRSEACASLTLSSRSSGVRATCANEIAKGTGLPPNALSTVSSLGDASTDHRTAPLGGRSELQIDL